MVGAAEAGPDRPLAVQPGRPEPRGVTLGPEGANVAVFSAGAERIELCLFDEGGAETRIRLPARTGDVHHGLVPGLKSGQLYGLRAHGPWHPEQGLRFNPAMLLLDPYATQVVRPQGFSSGVPDAAGFDDLLLRDEDTARTAMKGVIEAARPSTSRPAAPKPASRVIYELSVKGFTQSHPEVPEQIRGTFAGLAHPAAIGHLTGLGVTTVELMPVAAWADDRHLPPLGLANAWGYNPVVFFAPDPRLAPGGMAEVAAAVDALHRAGLEVILDVVLNHTAESDERGATFSLRGLDNRTYYRLAQDPRRYTNEAGTGHVLALDRAPVMRLAMDALRHWALAGGVDGFRFDLATVMGRRLAGFDPDAPLLAAIGQDPVLRERLMIAEPWDIGWGGYQLGAFPAGWSEWNDRFRDDVRRFWRGDGSVAALATRLAGSSDVLAARHRPPSSSVNFITAHDGFTLADMVAYAGKHNEANGEGNRDGKSGEAAWSNGQEGSSGDPQIQERRGRDVRALMATLLLSRGTPMLSMGSELGRTQLGNNNAYAQDNATTWVDWAGADRELQAFVAALVRFRLSRPELVREVYLTGALGQDGVPDAAWFAPDGTPMTDALWSGARQDTIGLALDAPQSRRRTLIWLHAGHQPVEVTLPQPRSGQRWSAIFASSTLPPADRVTDACTLEPRSVLVLEEAPGPQPRGTRTADPALLDQLADAAGIAADWYAIGGLHRVVSPDTKRTLLAAMNLPAQTAAQARDSLARVTALAPDAPKDRPGRCFRPEAIQDGRRRFGLSAQLYTLRREGDGGVGDFTTLKLLADEAGHAGAALVALNPFHTLFPSDRTRSSPYQPSDRRFLDPLYIDVAAVPEAEAARAYLAAQDGGLADLGGRRRVDYPAVWRIKREALALCFTQAFGQPERREALERFRAAGGPALERFAVFQALEAEAGSPAGVPADPGPMTGARAEAQTFAIYLQMLADEQLAGAGGRLEIGLYRDLAVGAAPDGAEVWASPDAFLHGVSVGAPPDPFSLEGQSWGIPPLDPIGLQTSGFAHFRELLAANMRHAGALRIDHAMALRRLFLVPEGASPLEGAYVRYPLEGMLEVLAQESRRARCLVIGEDLGTVPDGFRERLAASDVLSYRVLLFQRDEHGFLPPDAYPAGAAACVSTHDLPTLVGWWQGRDIALQHELGLTSEPDAEARRADDRRALMRAIGQPAAAAEGPLTPGIAGAVHRHLADTPSALALVQVEDLAGEPEPVNVPGTDAKAGNWERRLLPDTTTLLSGPVADAMLDAMRDAGRTAEASASSSRTAHLGDSAPRVR